MNNTLNGMNSILDTKEKRSVNFKTRQQKPPKMKHEERKISKNKIKVNRTSVSCVTTSGTLIYL